MGALAYDLPSKSVVSETAQFFGHPRGLATLFFTEMWERFSYTGMQALLFFFATATPEQGGLGWSVASAGALLGLYGALAFIGGIAGGWLADSWLGQRRAVSYGCCLIMLGHICMIGHGEGFLFGGLALLLLGMSMFKANMSTMVGMLYPPGDRRRDAGFSIFYMGISVGSVLAPLVCGFLAQSDQFRELLRSWGMRPERSWHWGFGSAAVGMSLGLMQYWAGQKHLGQVGLIDFATKSAAAKPQGARILVGVAVAGLLIALAAVLHVQGVVHIQMSSVTSALSIAVLLGSGVYILRILFNKKRLPAERRGVQILLILFPFATLFWAALALSGFSLLMFVARYTDSMIFGHTIPSAWWQSVGAVLIVALSPVISWLWLKLGKREPAFTMKFVLSFVLSSLAFLVLCAAALQLSSAHPHVRLGWLFFMCVLATLGELCLSPIGLSVVTKLAPAGAASQLMAMWFLTVAIGNVLGGQAVGLVEKISLPALFGGVSLFLFIAAIILALLASTIGRLSNGLK